MIKVFFGFDEECIRDIDLFFSNVYEEEWFEDDLVKQMVLDVDHSEVLSSRCIQSKVLGQIPPDSLSGGVKTLICMYELDDFYVDLITCGPNCQKWIARIASVKDVTVGMSGFDLSFEDCSINGICLNDQTAFSDWKQWTAKMCQFVGHVKKQ